ncbi:MAG: hypothetical protein WC269_05485 [Candidatus Gracilibacteria bacterium]|jgi:hypothetical protein
MRRECRRPVAWTKTEKQTRGVENDTAGEEGERDDEKVEGGPEALSAVFTTGQNVLERVINVGGDKIARVDDYWVSPDCECPIPSGEYGVAGGDTELDNGKPRKW